jgi:hypothetical protein
MTSKKAFGPVPMRAIADEDLTALDLRVLTLVAYRDRFSKNGIGCFEEISEMKKRLGGIPHEKSISRSLGKLFDRGYITRDRHPEKRRLMVYKGIYAEADFATVKRSTTREPVTEPVTDHADEPVTEKVTDEGRSVTENDPIGNMDFQKAERCQRDAGVEDSHNRGCAQAVNINSAGAASPYGSAKHGMKNAKKGDPDGARVAEIERRLKALNGRSLRMDEHDEFEALMNECYDIEEKRARANVLDGVHFQAQRLGGEIACLLPDNDDFHDIPF